LLLVVYVTRSSWQRHYQPQRQSTRIRTFIGR